MGIGDIQNRKHVLDAIAEYDRLGRDRFLEKYGFGPSRSYWLVHNRKQYDSKAVIGAAHGYARPDLGPMSADEFSGGEATVRRKLESLGFQVETRAAARTTPPHADSRPTDFLLTWKESGWPYEELREMVTSSKRMVPSRQPGASFHIEWPSPARGLALEARSGAQGNLRSGRDYR